MLNLPFGYPGPQVSMFDAAAPVFASEDSLKEFIDSMDQHQKSALYFMLHAVGCRFDPDALSRWRRSK